MTGVRQIRTTVMMLGSVHIGGYPRLLRTSLLIALRVSNTPSPVIATASMVGRPLDPLAVLLGHQELPLVLRVRQEAVRGPGRSPASRG